MKNIKKLMGVALVALSSLGTTAIVQSASASEFSHGQILQSLAQLTLQCANQPYHLNRNGHKVLKSMKSHCDNLQVSTDRAQYRVEGHTYTVVIKDSEYADDGDLNDVYLQTDSREDQEVILQKTVLAFGDPVLAIMLTTGQSPELLPQILDSDADRSEL